MKDIFKKRVNYKPFEYPEVQNFIDLINKTFWVHSEVDFSADIQDFKTKINPTEQEIIKRSLLSIAQVEVGVKSFWGNLYKHFPKPEFNGLGSTFSENEFRHSEAYSRLLEVLGYNEEFEKLIDIPVFKKKLELIEDNLGSEIDIVWKLLFFTIVIENASLFSQFANILSFTRFRGQMKNTSNIIAWTSMDEQCFHPDTEVMTPNGWKLIQKMEVGDDIYGFNEGKLKLERVINTTNKQFDGNLIEFKNDRSRKLVTPDHDVIIKDRGNWSKVKADSQISNFAQIPCTVNYMSGDRELLYNETDLTNVKLWEVSKQWCLRFIENKFKDEPYKEGSEDYLNKLQIIAILAGYETNLNDGKLYLLYHDTEENISNYDKTEVPYVGNVVCVTVPSGGLVTRLNNQVFISGNCHADAGVYLINTLKEEGHISQDMITRLRDAIRDYITYEEELLDWIYEEGELEFFTKTDMLNFMKHRVDKALKQMDIEPIYNITDSEYKPMLWFDEDIFANELDDFFAKRPVAYTKHDKSFTADDLF